MSQSKKCFLGIYCLITFLQYENLLRISVNITETYTIKGDNWLDRPYTNCGYYIYFCGYNHYFFILSAEPNRCKNRLGSAQTRKLWWLDCTFLVYVGLFQGYWRKYSSVLFSQLPVRRIYPQTILNVPK